MSALPDEVRRPELCVKDLQFSDGTTIAFQPGEIVVLVGPNNVGKSVALKNIDEKVAALRSPGIVVEDVTLAKHGDAGLVIRWLDATSRKTANHASSPTYHRMGARVNHAQAKELWSRADIGLGALRRFFVCHLTTEARLAAANPPKSVDLTTQPFTHPIHYLQANDSIEERISGYFRKAFGQHLIVHRNAGNNVPLYCGEKPSFNPHEDRVSVGYLRRLEALPTLESQGDGMRAFVGVLLHALVLDHAVLLIDEPEAFLHPPQARILGQMLVREFARDRQLFLATHSSDLLKGLLDVKSTRVRIIRLRRDGSVNPVTQLDNDGIRSVWADPILRSSNVLDGLFHSKVVVCEGDADCRFYAALRDTLCEDKASPATRHIMFTHCGGKGRIPVVVAALKTLDVPVAVIADFDLLNNKRNLQAVWKSLEGEWGLIEADWQQLFQAISTKKPDFDKANLQQEIDSILASVKAPYLPKEAAVQIRDLLRRSSAWAHAKMAGTAFVPSGDPTTACNRLLATLRLKGLFLVEVGELEGFARTIAGHGPKWVNAALEKDLLNDPELEPARTFVRQLLDHPGT